MSIIKYDLEVCTRNLYLAKNQISRSYDLLISDISEGKKYGFEYQFFRELQSNVEKSNLLADDSNSEKDIIKSNPILLGNPSKNTKTHIMNSSLATNNESLGIVNDGMNMVTNNDSEFKLFKMQDIADNALSIAHINKTLISMDDESSIGEKLDTIINATHKMYVDSIEMNHMRAFGKSISSLGYKDLHHEIAHREYDNNADINKDNIISDLDIVRKASDMDTMLILDNLESQAWIDHTYVIGNKNFTLGINSHEMFYYFYHIINRFQM